MQSRSRADDAAPAEPIQIDERVQRRIGEQLRAYYDELLNEPVPARFVELLIKLDEKERQERSP